MSDPLSPPFIAKVLAGLGGLVGGTLFMTFLRPKNVWDAAVRSGVSTTAAIIGSMPMLEYLGLHITTDNIIFISVVIGFCAWSVLSFAVRVLLKIQDEKTVIHLPFVSKKTKRH